MSAPAAFSDGYRRYALFVLLSVYIMNFVDRQILSILAEDIRKEIELSDTALGFLSGIAFALFYTFAGLPIARWADTGSRRTIISLALFVWSGMTALTGLAQGFGQLVAARVGVGIGEAGGSPPSHSLISDLYPPERRATALAIYSLGIPIGGALGSILGGWLGQKYGWRIAFMAVGIPGALLAVIVRLTLREPPRGRFDAVQAVTAEARESVRDVLRFMMRLPSFLHMAFGASLHAFYGYGAAYFVPVFLIRVHHMDKLEVGAWLGGIALTTGVIGISLGGAISDRLAARDPRWYMRVPAFASALAIPFAVIFYLWPDPRTAILLSVPGTLLGGVYLGPTFAMTQTLVKPQMRALASAILLFIINLIGLGGGPLMVGIVSDRLKPMYGDESVRYALLWIVTVGAAWATLQYLLAARTLERDLQAKHA
ncbi:MAG TPA: MFS transporter [Myxococcota bacterium]|nr:MFS transporter [Myxococcota bacterium]